MNFEQKNMNRILGNQRVEKRSTSLNIESSDKIKFLKIMTFLGIATAAIPNMKGIDEFANYFEKKLSAKASSLESNSSAPVLESYSPASVNKPNVFENEQEGEDFNIENISEESLSDEEKKQINEIFNFNSSIDLNAEKLELVSRQWKDRYENHVLYNREFEKASSQMKPHEQSLKNYFSQIGVPEEFIYLSIPESYARSKAKSHKGAVGFYQFMKGTGQQYGLEIKGKIDERTDLLKSGKACGKFLKDLHEELGDWDLALYGYNGGFVRKYAKEAKYIGTKPSKEGFLEYMEKMIRSVQKEVKSQSFVSYTPRKGDTLYSIARKHSADLDRLKSLNKISSAQKIRIGQKIKIPLTQKNREEIFQKRISGFVENITYVEKCNAACQKANRKSS